MVTFLDNMYMHFLLLLNLLIVFAENANTCFTDGKGEGEEGVCTCNDQFDWFDGKCLKGMM